MTKSDYEYLIKTWNMKKNDEQRFSFLIDNPRCGLVLVLDNDSMYLRVSDIDESLSDIELGELNDSITSVFDQWLGNSTGVIALLGVLDIDCELC